LWATAGVPGELSQVLPSPVHFEQVTQLVTKDMTRSSTVAGKDVDKHVEAFRTYADAGFDEIYIANMGPNYRDFFDLYREKVLPRIR
jgi:hypothetical protein